MRAVYADWLLERGDPLGELIQLQRRIESLPEGMARVEFQAHEAELLRKVVVRDHRWRSLRGWITHELEALGASSCTIRRGFVEHFEIDATRLRANATALFALTPVTSLHVRDATAADVIAIAELPELARIRTLEIVSTVHGINDLAAAALGRSPHVGGLQRLELSRGMIGGDGLAMMCREGALPNLRELALSSQDVHSVKQFTSWSGVRRLESLSLSVCRLDSIAAAELAAAPFERLTALDLTGNTLRITGARALAAAAHLDRLVRLQVDGCRLTPRGVDEIASSPNLPALRELRVGGLTDAEQQALRERLAQPRTGSRRVLAPPRARPARKRARARD